MRHAPTILLTTAIVLLPLALWVETTYARVWNDRLLWPSYIYEQNRHTPIFTNGTYLPPVITRDTTLTAKDNPIILTQTTQVAPQTTLTLEPGTYIFAHEHGRLVIDGTLEIQGAKENLVTITSNEQHPENRIWAGITFNKKSKGSINYAKIQYGSPAITCLDASSAAITNTNILYGNLGLFTTNASCSIKDSSIRYTRDGIIDIGKKSTITNTQFSTQNNKITYIP